MFYVVVHRYGQSVVTAFKEEQQALHHLKLSAQSGESLGLGYIERSAGKVRLADPFEQMPEGFAKQALRTRVLSAHFLYANLTI